LNAKLRRAVRARGHFPTDESALKLLFLVLNLAQIEWRMPPREWAMAKAQFGDMSAGQRIGPRKGKNRSLAWLPLPPDAALRAHAAAAGVT
jgi:hypothetical protein